MIIKESQYSYSLQRYNKNDVDAIVAQEPRLSQRFLMKICDFVLGEKIPFNDVRVLFAKIQDGNLMIPIPFLKKYVYISYLKGINSYINL